MKSECFVPSYRAPDNCRCHSIETYYFKNSGKYNFTDQTNKNQKDEKRQIEDKETSNSYETEAVEFLDHINVDNGDFDDNAIDYIAEFI